MDNPLPDNIFIAGQMGSGKDFIARRLIEELGYTKLAWAAPLYEAVAEEAGIPLPQLLLNKAQYRHRLQSLGEERRKDDPDYWVKRWAERRAEIPGPVVVPDTRYHNEALYAMSIAGLVIRVWVPHWVRVQRLSERDGQYNEEWDNHPSERHIPVLPAHLDIPGDLPPDRIVATIQMGYNALVQFLLKVSR